ncbi:hypothetical protein B0T14DRAFT_565587 [Immersiella caudata]|uniref:Uncharacterized protein n=1 Tax=Immersiella caudata TaxID=314043 RepID=A0AA40C3R7_9PEZI|nr:hypothetical protein B0T14DRAFT_565587 [Immersiella caudata]
MTSIRLRGLESSAQFDQIMRQITPRNSLHTACTSGIAASDSNESDRDIEATITFKCAKDQKHARDCIHKYPEVKVDDNFLGVTDLASAASRNAPFPVDIVTAHGLRGHAANTWTHAGPEPAPHMWIRDFIPTKLPGARVMTFGYDASLLSGSMVGIDEAAKQLLDGLALVRPSNTCALSLSQLNIGQSGDIHKKTCSIVFFGTPHRGSRKANLAKVVSRVMSILRPVSNCNLDALKEN